MENIVKSAIARVFTAIINADGIVSSRELQCLDRNDKNDLMHKYGLKQKDLEDVELTFAEAVNLIMSAEGIRYLEERKLNLVSLSMDMENLARADGCIHPKEALLCTVFGRAIERNASVSLVSFDNSGLRFSKQEVIYVECDWSDDINKEIEGNYHAIRFILESFGFSFIYLPIVRDTFFNYGNEYKLQIIKYYYPKQYSEKQKDSLLIQFNNKLQSDIDKYTVTKSFSEMLFGDKFGVIEPSFLIKIGTTQKRNPNGLTDFVMLKIGEKSKGNDGKGGALFALTDFLKKYNELCEKNSIMIQRGNATNEFNAKSFDKTFLDYLYGRVEEINIYIHGKSIIFCFGNFNTISFKLGSNSKGISEQIALYMVELYYSSTNGLIHFPSKEREKLRNNERELLLKEQYDKFRIVHNRLTTIANIKDYYDIDWFYDNLNKMHIALRTSFAGAVKNRSIVEKEGIMRFFPLYDKHNKKVLIPQIVCKVEGVFLKEWIEAN